MSETETYEYEYDVIARLTTYLHAGLSATKAVDRLLIVDEGLPPAHVARLRDVGSARNINYSVKKGAEELGIESGATAETVACDDCGETFYNVAVYRNHRRWDCSSDADDAPLDEATEGEQ